MGPNDVYDEERVKNDDEAQERGAWPLGQHRKRDKLNQTWQGLLSHGLNFVFNHDHDHDDNHDCSTHSIGNVQDNLALKFSKLSYLFGYGCEKLVKNL